MSAAIRNDLSIQHFENGEIDAEKFDHAAHLYVAWLYVGAYELPTAITRFDTALKQLVQNLGETNEYHTTMTWFFLLVIAERHEKEESWSTFCNRNPDLTSNSEDFLSRYYSPARLFSSRARTRFLLPDLSFRNHSQVQERCP